VQRRTRFIVTYRTFNGHLCERAILASPLAVPYASNRS
jgi:hypothetical protein